MYRLAMVVVVVVRFGRAVQLAADLLFSLSPLGGNLPSMDERHMSSVHRFAVTVTTLRFSVRLVPRQDNLCNSYAHHNDFVFIIKIRCIIALWRATARERVSGGNGSLITSGGARRRRPPTASRLKGPRKQKSFAYKLLKRGLAKSFAYKLLKRGLANLMSPTSTSGVAPPLIRVSDTNATHQTHFSELPANDAMRGYNAPDPSFSPFLTYAIATLSRPT
ncbi:hypothetical protein EVAR_102919_1 [Eumeta japonica]|uniref:Secreted protein n=1 Tax=Eumeta variegata TaxID=151549 RepID=A0A4C1ZK77_EUMVA|nr:hypothetical protein EVAR_102919_1 [Eumeta japonica]